MNKIAFTLILIVLTASTTRALSVDDLAPAFSLRDSNGEYYYFSDHIGPTKKQHVKGIIINFFASYCEPCKRELPVLNSLVKELNEKGVKVVIVGFKENFDKINILLDQIKVDKPIILSDTYGKTGQKYGVTHLPITFFINADGKVTDVIRGELPNLEKVFREKSGKLLK